MTYILFLIITVADCKTCDIRSVSSSNANFTNEINCLQAIPKLLDMEKKFGVRVQATCVKK